MPLVLALGLLLPATLAVAQDRPLPDPKPFLEQVKKRLQTDDDRQSAYMYVETRREQKLDKKGNPTGESVKVFESYPALPGERRWRRKVAEDGRPMPQRDLDKQDRQRREHAEEYARKLATEPEKVKQRLAKERERDRREAEESVNEIWTVFDIRMAGRDALEGHDTIVFTLTPRPNAKPKTRDGKIMKNFSARAWISESDHELVRLEIEAIDTLSFGLGLLARVHKGSKGAFQRRKVNGEEWLPLRSTYTASARIALFKMMRRGGTSEYSDYRKFSVDTSATYAQPKPPDR